MLVVAPVRLDSLCFRFELKECRQKLTLVLSAFGLPLAIPTNSAKVVPLLLNPLCRRLETPRRCTGTALHARGARRRPF